LSSSIKKLAGYVLRVGLTGRRKPIHNTGTEMTAVFEQLDADDYKTSADVPNGFRAKISLLVSALSRLYVAVSGKSKASAKLARQVFESFRELTTANLVLPNDNF
jgi:hypothetical protein